MKCEFSGAILKSIWIVILAVLFCFSGSALYSDKPQRSELRQGIVVERSGSVMSVEAWQADSDPFYVLETVEAAGNAAPQSNPSELNTVRVLLRPSSKVIAEKIRRLKGSYIFATGYYTEGQEYVPSHPGEVYPVETSPDSSESRPRRRGAGFVVQTVIVPFMFDNGPDGFSQGLARFVENNKIGFFNQAGVMTIRARFDFALPFSERLAVFCTGCRKVQDGEHYRYTGGRWGYIDLTGKVIFAARYQEAEPFQNGHARAKLNGKWISLTNPLH